MKRSTPCILAAAVLALGVAAHLELRGAPAPAAASAVDTASTDEPTVAASALAALRRSRAHVPAAEPGEPFADPELPTAPQLDPGSGALVHAAVAAGVQRCVAEALARQPDLGERLAVAYRVEARDGRLRVLDANALAELADETLTACIGQAAAATSIASPGQPDGVQEMTLFF